ncbi:HTH-type transcriptional regulator GltC [Enhygromyxa salina]|uniref:HTH-type transcriptional regulator GltC n=1 Tax=Enhygromyxa salina TaxID=215803 RepID=A0A2S9XRP6_9BACT|nr:LysR family transcriptional regulator [Enhygromyxa salina]PRP95371.1 HTH-type transcriptional regulator GltC [Enhygromyxa salina]
MDRWDDLRHFLAVARRGTLTAAAEDLGLNASTLHRRLAALEEQVGAGLFEKGPRGYRLSAVGEALLPRAEEVEEAVFAAARTVVGHDEQVSGDVRVTLPVDFLTAVGPHLVAFRDRCTRVRPIVLADNALLDLGRGADIALRPTQRPPESVVGRRLVEIAWCRYAPSSSSGDGLPWLHYLGLGHVGPIAWRRKTFAGDEPLLLVEQVAAMHALLRMTPAQGLLPCFLGDPDPQLRRVGEPAEATTTLWLLIHADLRRAARVRALVDFLVPRVLADRALYEGESV